MENSKTSELEDRLSELPDSLIFDIFWLMPMEDVVRTPVLSKRWEKLWTISPHLNFKLRREFEDTHSIRTFINRALICWRGIKILKFKIGFESYNMQSLYSDIDFWLRFAMDNGVEELYLEFAYEDNYNNMQSLYSDYYYLLPMVTRPYLVPKSLYSYPLLKVLSVTWCNLQIDGNVLWNRLKVLDIRVYGFNQHCSDHILSGSPQLEAFSLTFRDNDDPDMSIRSSSLKKLFIYMALPTDTLLTICSPNLEILEMVGHPHRIKCLQLDISSLTHATLWMGHCLNHTDHFIQEAFRHILPAIKYVESFTLADWCLQVLAGMKKKGLLSPFPNVKFLKLGVYVEVYEQIVGLLEIFPNLKRLAIQDIPAYFPVHYPEFVNLNIDRPKSFLLQLRTVDVTWAEGDYIFPFIALLLKYASKLERMVFRARDPIYLHIASQRLLRMKRSSPNAELIFCEYYY